MRIMVDFTQLTANESATKELGINSANYSAEHGGKCGIDLSLTFIIKLI